MPEICWEEIGEDYNLASYTTYIVFVNVIDKWLGTRSLKSISHNRFLEKLFKPVFHLLSEFLTKICWEQVGEDYNLATYTTYIVFVNVIDKWLGTYSLK